MAQHEQLCVLGCLPAGQQSKPAEELAEDQVEESKHHRWRSSRPSTIEAKAAGQRHGRGYNKRLRAARAQVIYFIRALATDTDLWTDDVWIADSTPIECGRSRETVKRSALAGWAGYGYCRSHSRYFWGLRLHLVCTVHGLPTAFALATPKADERDVLVSIFDVVCA